MTLANNPFYMKAKRIHNEDEQEGRKGTSLTKALNAEKKGVRISFIRMV